MKKTKAKSLSLMIQGTASSVGKSLLAAGLCRVFRQDGFSVAPFKSQNMALNSFITPDGLEMGRAQAVQAEAAGITPSADMNPILLKPTGESTSQVIVNGGFVAALPAAEYFRRKSEFVPAIQSAYARLAAAHDIVVIEGAGSPAEINLKDNDIVNMGVARMADAPVLLVGDIDRGGVFASLYGTLALLEPAERARVRGLVVNKFRGDAELLRPGLAQLEALTAKPVVGVVPWTRLDIDEEDSASERFGAARGARPDPAKLLDAAVIRLPRIANFTDFAALERHPAFSVRYVETRRELGAPDLLIFPGTNNAAADSAWLRQNGLAAAVQNLVSSDTRAIGIEAGRAVLTEICGAASAGAERKHPHALFDSGGFADSLAAKLLAAKGCAAAPAAAFDPAAHRESQYDLLAATLRAALDMPAVYGIMRRES